MTIHGRKFQGKGITNEEMGNNLLLLGSFLMVMGVIFFPFAAYSSMKYREVLTWPDVQASILSVGPRSPVIMRYSKNNSRGTKTILYFVQAKYRYTFKEQTFTGIGEFGYSNSPETPVYKQEMKRLTSMFAASSPLSIVVNPKRPFESYVSRDKKVSFSSVVGLWTLTLLFLFGGPTCKLIGNSFLRRS